MTGKRKEDGLTGTYSPFTNSLSLYVNEARVSTLINI